jgi:hypothetical protein
MPYARIVVRAREYARGLVHAILPRASYSTGLCVMRALAHAM